MSTQQELINIQKHNYKSYVNSQIILADVKLTNSEKQVRELADTVVKKDVLY